MADDKKGFHENVDKDGGSKGHSSSGRGKGPSVSQHDGGSAGFSSGKKTSANSTEQSHNVDYAEGGDTHMFGKQEAGSRTSDDKSKSTGKPDSSGPGEKFASGGKTKMFGFAGALPATAGISAARES